MRRMYLVSIGLVTMLLALSTVMVGRADALVITDTCIVDMAGTLSSGERFSGYIAPDENGVVGGIFEYWSAPESQATCDDYAGALKGLCQAYCEAMKCAGDAPEASQPACESVRKTFFNAGGLRLPCGPDFIGNADEMYCHRDGTIIMDFWGIGSWNGVPGHTFWARAEDATLPMPDYFQTRIWAPDGSVIVDTGDYISSGDISYHPWP